MHSTIKNITAVAVILVLFLLVWEGKYYVDTYSQSIQPSSFRSFSVSADGKEVGIPDVAQFSFSVITEGGKDISALQKDNSGKVNKAIEFVKTSLVEAKDITTLQYSLEPRYQYYNCRAPVEGGSKPCPPSEIVGYTIQQSVLVKIRDFTKIGSVLSGVIQQGANSVSELRFKVDDPSSLQDKARAKAIEKAQKRATAVAEAGGFKVGRLLSIDEGGYNPPYYPVMADAKAMGGGGDIMPIANIEPGSQEVSVSVTLRYEIQ
jgi:uncharacterized protein YggE